VRIANIVLVLGMWNAGVALAERPSVTREEASVLQRAGAVAETNAAAAVTLLDAARRGDRSSAALDYSLGNLLVELEDFEAAEDAFRAAHEKAPLFKEARIGLGRALVLQSRWADAEQTLRGLTGASDASEEVLLLYGYVLLELNRLVSAESVYRRAVLAGGESPDALYGLARCFMEQERFSECAAVMEELVQRRPDEASYWALLADVRLAANRPDGALVALETARRLDVMTPRMRVLLGDLYMNRQRPEAALTAYQAALDAAPGDAAIRLKLAESLLMAGRTDDAGVLLDAHVDAGDEQDIGYYRARAQWAEQTGRDAEAQAAYRAWVKLDPVQEQALLALGDLLHAAGKLSEAETWYDRARVAHPQRTAPLLRLAQIAMDRADYESAEKHLEHAHVLSGDASIERSLQQVRRLRAIER